MEDIHFNVPEITGTTGMCVQPGQRHRSLHPREQIQILYVQQLQFLQSTDISPQWFPFPGTVQKWCGKPHSMHAGTRWAPSLSFPLLQSLKPLGGLSSPVNIQRSQSSLGWLVFRPSRSSLKWRQQSCRGHSAICLPCLLGMCLEMFEILMAHKGRSVVTRLLLPGCRWPWVAWSLYLWFVGLWSQFKQTDSVGVQS